MATQSDLVSRDRVIAELLKLEIDIGGQTAISTARACNDTVRRCVQVVRDMEPEVRGDG